MTVSPLSEAKRAAEIRRIERLERLQAVSDYLAFPVSKLAGAGSVVVGCMGLLAPHAIVIPFVVAHAATIAGAGLSILVGPQTAKRLATIVS